MKKKNIFFIISLSLLCSNLLMAQFTINDFYKLHSLSGVWKRDVSRGMNQELWTKISDFEMKASAYNISNSDTILRESVVLTFKDGVIKYEVTAFDQNDNKAIPFILTNIKNDVFTFENPNHDFPNKIIYDISDKNKISAMVEGIINGSMKKIDYNFNRVE